MGALSTQAVYDCLEALTNAGLARRIEPAGHPRGTRGGSGTTTTTSSAADCGATADVDCVVGRRAVPDALARPASSSTRPRSSSGALPRLRQAELHQTRTSSDTERGDAA